MIEKLGFFGVSVFVHLFFLQIKLDDGGTDILGHREFKRINIILSSSSLIKFSKVRQFQKISNNKQTSSPVISSEVVNLKEEVSPIIAPYYPRVSRIKGHQGKVKIAYSIDRDGNWIYKRIETSSGFIELDNAAFDALEVNRFRLPRLGIKYIVFNFSLEP
ncbi:MAG: hypothetical protein A2381_09520 [Bdellovibrionales bacterium RIFOXYB1_FULL_37_110]|nr:MAG: hypothetical protein A2417_02975 [Bdellovibrionales bacterium RIFOXYC1_FULL_37_79]OFZ59502.1 MAG: hypothetical protein A2381_09520 [Bdellovibrionales bacterium RIFOXYB1_FULL_37_110]OFZ64221.1 MAG: hypothetical protein A2577_12370 [Bdellovibrionales bacterium RIFOXYD1_FULL_36_51]